MTTPKTDALMALADRYAFHIPGSQHSDEARAVLLAALQEQAREGEAAAPGLNRLLTELSTFAEANPGTYIFPRWDGSRVMKHLRKAPQPAQPEQGERPASKAELLKNLTQWLDGLGLEIHTYSLRGIALHGFEKGWDAALQSAQPVALPLTPEELDLCRQWFNSIQDVNGGYLTTLDYVLAEKLYRQLNMRVPNSISEITKSGIGGKL